jgi:hypothetical protein
MLIVSIKFTVLAKDETGERALTLHVVPDDEKNEVWELPRSLEPDESLKSEEKAGLYAARTLMKNTHQLLGMNQTIARQVKNQFLEKMELHLESMGNRFRKEIDISFPIDKDYAEGA